MASHGWPCVWVIGLVIASCSNTTENKSSKEGNRCSVSFYTAGAIDVAILEFCELEFCDTRMQTRNELPAMASKNPSWPASPLSYETCWPKPHGQQWLAVCLGHWSGFSHWVLASTTAEQIMHRKRATDVRLISIQLGQCPRALRLR